MFFYRYQYILAPKTLSTYYFQRKSKNCKDNSNYHILEIENPKFVPFS